MNNIKHYRKKVRLTQAQAAEAAGWEYQSRWSGYESGNRTPSVGDAQLIVQTLNKFGAACMLDDVFPPAPANDIGAPAMAEAG